MGKRKFSKKDLINLLIKKASGFHYQEEQLEYEKSQKQSKINENKYSNVSFFDNYDRGTQQISQTHDSIELSNGKEILNQTHENLILTKKKVTTHYISPDMLAIKILFEIYGKKVGDNNIEQLTDEELIKMKNTLLKELSDETNQDK